MKHSIYLLRLLVLLFIIGCAFHDVKAQESVTITSAPNVVFTSGTFPISLTYTSSANREIEVFLESKFLRKLSIRNRISVSAGSGSTNINVTVNRPPQETGYRWVAYLLPVGETRIWQAINTNRTVAVATVLGGGDDIELVSAPAMIGQEGNHDIVVAYSTDGLRDVFVDLLRPSDNFAFFGGSQRVSNILAGTSGIVTVNLAVINTPPLGNDYIWSANLTPPGGVFPLISANVEQSVSVVQGDTLSISSSAPTCILPGQSYTVDVSYTTSLITSTQDRDVVVSFLHDGDFAFFGDGRISNIPAGSSGLTSVVVNISNSPAPLPATDYIWSSFMGPPGGAFNDRFTSAENVPAKVEAGDSLSFTNPPTIITSSGIYTVSVDYVASTLVSTNARDITVTLLSAGDFMFFGGGSITGLLAGSTGIVSTVVSVINAPPLGTNYLWAANISPPGGGFTNSFATAQDVAVEIVSMIINEPMFASAVLKQHASGLVLETMEDGRYSIESTDNLSSGMWSNRYTVSTSAGGTLSISNLIGQQDCQFFRVHEELSNQ